MVNIIYYEWFCAKTKNLILIVECATFNVVKIKHWEYTNKNSTLYF